MLIELLRPAGPELGRRWLAALLLVPEGERERLVQEIERRIVEAYASGQDAQAGRPVEMHVVSPPVQRDGYIEQIHTTYEVVRAEERHANGDAPDAEAAG